MNDGPGINVSVDWARFGAFCGEAILRGATVLGLWIAIGLLVSERPIEETWRMFIDLWLGARR